MRIDRIEIDAFGGLKEFSLHLREGFQAVLGGNEEGKTTVMSFLKIMFYSKVKNPRSSLEDNLRKKYTPWDGSPMGGAVEFSAGGRRYRLQKSIGDSPAKDRTQLFDLDTGDPELLGRDEEVGKHVFGLDLEGFERSFFIGRVGKIPPPGGNDDVARQLIANLVQSGEEELSSQTVVNNLMAAQEELVSKSGKKGLLVEARERLEDRKREKQQVQSVLREQEQTQARCRRLEDKLERRKTLEQKLAGLEASKQLARLDELVVKAGQLDLLKSQLPRPDIPLEEIPAFLAQLEEKRQALQHAYAAYTGLAQTEPDTPEEPVQEEDYRQAAALAERSAANRALKGSLEETLYPILADYGAKAAARDEAREKSEARAEAQSPLLPTLEEDRELQTREAELSNGLNALQMEMEGMTPLWEERKALAQKWVDTQEKGEAAGKGGAGRWVAAVLIAAAVMAAYYVTNLLPVLAGLPLAFLPVIISALRARKTRDEVGRKAQRAISDAMQARMEAEERIAAEQQDYKARMDTMLAEIQEVAAARQELRPQLERLAQLKEEGAELEKELARADMALEEVLASYRRQLYYLEPALAAAREKGVAFTPPPELPDQWNPQEAFAALDAAQEELTGQLYTLLELHGCVRVEELQEKWMRQQTDLKSRQALAQARGVMETARREFCAAASRYEPVENLQQAQAMLDGLNERWSRYRELGSGLNSMAAGMGLSADTAALLEERRRLEQIAGRRDPADSPEEEQLLRELKGMPKEPLERELMSLQAQMRSPDRAPAQIEEEMEQLRQSINAMEARYDHLGLALELMLQAAEEMRRSFGPALNRSTGEILEQLTGGCYSQVLVTKDYEVRVKHGTHLREQAFLSDGTVDQVYLALRLAISRMISPKGDPLPLILDDVLMQYDDARARRCMRYLVGLAKMEGIQMLLFTCHGHIADYAREHQAPVLQIASAPATV